ncbi:MAG: methyltransferase, partial [Anaerolineae bacterium]|nr:methyltransferase [Anaerolineae bacterium]
MSTSRERVMQAVNHCQPDRVPIDLGGHRSSGIMAMAYARLKEYLDITSGDIYVYDLVQQLAIIEPVVLDRFGVDTIELGRGFSLRDEDWADWTLPDGTPCKIPAYIHPQKVGDDWHVYDDQGTLIAIQKAGSLYFEQTHYPLLGSDAQDFPDLEASFPHSMWNALGSPPAPIGYDAEGLAQLEAGAR